jgi:hypothetical protein
MAAVLLLVMLALLLFLIYSMVQTVRERNRTIEHRFNLPWSVEAASAHSFLS